jgi:hypothetical protein
MSSSVERVKTPVILPATLDEYATAYHEAGHCVCAFRLEIPFTGRKALTIIPGDGYAGHFVHNRVLPNLELDNSDRARIKMERVVQMLLAGIEAQRTFNEGSIQYRGPFGDWDGGSDYHTAIEFISRFASGTKEVELYLELLRHRAWNLVTLDTNWKCIDALAKRLLQCKTLSAREAVSTIQDTVRALIWTAPSAITDYFEGGVSFASSLE